MSLPVLSICMAGRDDDYMLDFRYRIETTLNFYGRSLGNLGRASQVEILVTDWGSAIPLSDTLSLDEETRSIAGFIHVPPEKIREAQAGADSYHTARALNVSLRRARGRFVFITNTDQVMSEWSVESVLRLLEGEIHVPVQLAKTFMVVPRLQVPWQFVQRKPSLEEWERLMLFGENALLHQPFPPESNWFGSTSGFIFSSELNQVLRGMDESQPGWGWGDIELAFRSLRAGPALYLGGLGVSAFHMGHPPAGSRYTRRIVNSLLWNDGSRNPDDWGMGEIQLSVTRAQPTKTSSDAKVPETAVRSYLEDVAKELASDEPAERVVRAIWGFRQKKGSLSADTKGLRYLSWYSMCRHPRRYLEIGFAERFRSAVVVDACPSVWICGIAHMEGEMPGAFLPSQMHTLAEHGHRGCFHFLNEETKAGLAGLEKVRALFPDFDLIAVDAADPCAATMEDIIRLFRLLAPGGALVFGCTSAATFQTTWDNCRSALTDQPAVLYRSSEESAGMVLKLPDSYRQFLPSTRDISIQLKPMIDVARSLEGRSRGPAHIRYLRLFWKQVNRLKDALNKRARL